MKTIDTRGCTICSCITCLMLHHCVQILSDDICMIRSSLRYLQMHFMDCILFKYSTVICAKKARDTTRLSGIPNKVSIFTSTILAVNPPSTRTRMPQWRQLSSTVFFFQKGFVVLLCTKYCFLNNYSSDPIKLVILYLYHFSGSDFAVISVKSQRIRSKNELCILIRKSHFSKVVLK